MRASPKRSKPILPQNHVSLCYHNICQRQSSFAKRSDFWTMTRVKKIEGGACLKGHLLHERWLFCYILLSRNAVRSYQVFFNLHVDEKFGFENEISRSYPPRLRQQFVKNQRNQIEIEICSLYSVFPQPHLEIQTYWVLKKHFS